MTATGTLPLRMSTELDYGPASPLMALVRYDDGPGPIANRLTAWRVRRGFTFAELAVHTGLPAQLIRDVEAGNDWVDRRRVLSTLASVLRVGTAELTGQPYPPSGKEHVVVRAAAWHVRRHVMCAEFLGGVSPSVGKPDLAPRAQAVRMAEAVGDERTLAIVLPDLLEAADRLTMAADGRDGEEDGVRAFVYVSTAGLMRRLGYHDLAWSVLHHARPAGASQLLALAEEVRLLTSMGFAEHAIFRVERFGDVQHPVPLVCASALAHAVAGQRQRAEDLLESAVGRAAGEDEVSAVAVARAGCAVEFGVVDEVLELESMAASLPAARRSNLLLFGAAAWARLGHADRAVERLAAAESAAPLYVRLDPLARELLHALRSRVRTAHSTEALTRIGTAFGVS